MTDLIQRLSDEADLCRNEGADDIAILIDDAVYEIVRQRNNAGILQLQVSEQAAEIARLRADAERLMAACENARDIIATDRQAFVDCQRLRDIRTESPIEHGLVWVDAETWIAPEDAEPLRDYDRALAQIDAALRQEQPTKGEGA